jgi:hypothetical protein
MNKERMQIIVDRIEANPACWKQSSWHCGTSHCLAGHAQIDSGANPDNNTVRRDARMWLDLSLSEANYLFAGTRTIEDFKAALTDSYDRAGYDRDVYDRAGYDRDGYNRAGYDRDGYNRAGYDRDVYDRAGYDRDGYDRDDLDKNNKPKPDSV